MIQTLCICFLSSIFLREYSLGCKISIDKHKNGSFIYITEQLANMGTFGM